MSEYIDAGAFASDPDWFKPYESEGMKVYVFNEKTGKTRVSKHEQILIYNENASEVHILEYQEILR